MFNASYGEDTSNEQQKLLKIQTELAEQKQKLRLTRAEEQRALSSLFVIKKNLSLAKKSLSEAKGRVNYNQKRMAELKKELAAAEISIRDESYNLKHRIREVYKSGSGGFLDILFASRSMSDFINRTYYFGRIINKDVELISDIRQQVEQIRSARVQLESSNREIRDSLKVIETQKREISRADAEGQRTYKFLHGRRRNMRGASGSLKQAASRSSGSSGPAEGRRLFLPESSAGLLRAVSGSFQSSDIEGTRSGEGLISIPGST